MVKSNTLKLSFTNLDTVVIVRIHRTKVYKILPKACNLRFIDRTKPVCFVVYFSLYLGKDIMNKDIFLKY